MSANCQFCGEPVDPLSKFTWKRTIGWARPGKAGGSDIAAREAIPDQFACDVCVRRLQEGLSPLQGQLV